MLLSQLSAVTTAFTLSHLIPISTAHVIMNTPTPYGTPQTSPLDGTTFPFPCQLHSSADLTIHEVTPIVAGSTTLVKFTGSAVHGGGSCEFSLNYGDPLSTDPADWHVIYTIIGGCPASAAGNLPTVGTDADQRPDGPQCGDSTGVECVRQFEVPIPKGVQNGNATFAWSWFNKIGNREMYMNCAPVAVSGGVDGGGNGGFVKSLPNIFMANIQEKPCLTAKPAGAVLNIPNPGNFGEILETPDPEAIGNCSPGKTVPLPKFAGGNGAVGTNSSSDSSSVLSSTLSSSASGFVTSTRPAGGVFITVSAPGTAKDTAISSSSINSTSSLPSPATQPTSTSTFVTTVATASSPPTENPADGTVPCDASSSSFFCIDATHFGLCNFGSAIPQQVAPGTTCDVTQNQIVASG